MKGNYRGSVIVIGRLHEENGCMSDCFTMMQVQSSVLVPRCRAGMSCLNITDLCNICNLIFQMSSCSSSSFSAALGLKT